MRTFGNILWVIFGGLIWAIIEFLSGLMVSRHKGEEIIPSPVPSTAPSFLALLRSFIMGATIRSPLYGYEQSLPILAYVRAFAFGMRARKRGERHRRSP